MVPGELEQQCNAWEKPKNIQKKQQKSEQTKELIKKQREEDANDAETKIEQYCDATFPLLSIIRRKIRQLLKACGSWPLRKEFIDKFYKDQEKSTGEIYRYHDHCFVTPSHASSVIGRKKAFILLDGHNRTIGANDMPNTTLQLLDCLK
jgi:hypothetical protein